MQRGGECVRGKLRDKRADARQDRFKRDIIERRRPARRQNSALVLLHRQLEDDYPPIDEDELDGAVAGKKN
jgi:hypothetical protein